MLFKLFYIDFILIFVTSFVLFLLHCNLFMLYRFLLPDKLEDYKNIFKVDVKCIEKTLNENVDDKNNENNLVKNVDDEEIKTYSVISLNETAGDRDLKTIPVKNDHENDLSGQKPETDTSTKGEGSS